MIRFRVDGMPTPKGRPRFTKRGNFVTTYTDKKTKDAEIDFATQARVFKPKKPMQGPIELTIIFATIKPKSKPKKVKYWTTRPDLDNFVKLVKDSLNKIFWHDDSQIVTLHAKKIYDETYYTDVVIEELDLPDSKQLKLKDG